jgi:hypothetical protein
VMAKYAEQRAASPESQNKPFELTTEYLIANGY